MPENITIAVFVIGAVMLLISIVGGRFKIFGAEISTVVGPTGRILAGVVGTIFIVIGLHKSLDNSNSQKVATQAEAKSEALPATFVLRKLTSIRPQEPGGEDRVYLKLGDSKPTDPWKLKAGESVRVDLTAAAGTSVSLYEMDGVWADGDDDFLGTAKLLSRGGKLHFKIPEIGKHYYTLSYEPES